MSLKYIALLLLAGFGLGFFPIHFGSAYATQSPIITLEAPSALQPLIPGLRESTQKHINSLVELMGLDHPGPPIRVILAPNASELAQKTPEWISGYALGKSSTIVLFPDRVTSYPYHSLQEVLLHELGHIFIHRASGGYPVPRWFHEGLAMIAARTWQLEDRARLVWAMITIDQVTLDDLDIMFQMNEHSARQAYVLAHAFVLDLIEHTHPALPKRLFKRMRDGIPFSEAFAQTTSMTLSLAERRFWDWQTVWNRWVPVATSSGMVWLIITLLSFVVYKRQRKRTAAIKQRWDEEDFHS